MTDAAVAVEPSEGWGWPISDMGIKSSRAHYFKEGASLCGLWPVFNGAFLVEEARELNTHCAACRKVLREEN